METRVFPSGSQLGENLASIIVTGILQAKQSGKPYVLGCPAGRSGRTTYRALSRMIAREKIPVDHLFIVLMDAYVSRVENSFEQIPKGWHCSCHRFAEEEIIGPINLAAPQGSGIPDDHVWVPDPNSANEFDAKIGSIGGIDLFLLASGSTDGHVGFNPPGSSRDSRTRVLELAESTRRDNLKTYPDFDSLGDVPRYGVTVGISTIADLARSAVLITCGTEKATTFNRLSSCVKYDESWPASVIWDCRNPSIFSDAAAAGTSG
ncbi:6-phosphogluconolactonase [Streptomyces bottropensis]|uniref:Glucosamine/galactosamine-6-phosphate isomerase domain-containing protein n=1 Tax=Streptomyces bottropensis TaxID=42235 RepID=A0ABU8AKF8_9ACTN